MEKYYRLQAAGTGFSAAWEITLVERVARRLSIAGESARRRSRAIGSKSRPSGVLSQLRSIDSHARGGDDDLVVALADDVAVDLLGDLAQLVDDVFDRAVVGP